MNFSLSYGPLTYFHILYIKNPKRTFLKKDLLHFLPSLLLDVFLFTALFLYIRAHIEWAYEHILFIQSLSLYLTCLGIVQLAIYTFLIYKASVSIKRVFREFQEVKKWLNYIIYLWSILIGFLLLAITFGLIFIENLDKNSALLYKPLGVFMGLCIYLLGYLYILKYAEVIKNYAKRISNFNISEEELEHLKNKILFTLKEEKLYKDSSITIAKFANHISWPINKLSTVINESFQTNFNDLINHYRITAFKEKIIHPDSNKYSIMGLALEVGFSSKASFYRAFKKETGTTPTKYLNTKT